MNRTAAHLQRSAGHLRRTCTNALMWYRRGDWLCASRSGICYTAVQGLTDNMRKLGQFLAVFAILALLAPSLRWVGVPAGGETCACPPGACMCPMHHHSLGSTHKCGMANGGQCGLGSPDDMLGTILSNLVFVPSESHFMNAWQSTDYIHAALPLNLLPAHAQPLDQPPRPTH